VRLLVVGAGGHAKVVIDAAEAAGHTIAGVVGTPSDAAEILGYMVVADAAGVEADGFVVAIGDNVTRSRIYAEYAATGLEPAAVVHPSVIVGTDVVLGGGTFAAAGVVINTGARIGDDTILNTGCSVDHDCVIGAHSHIGPQVALCGGVILGEGVLLGVGSCASPRASVGAWSVVGAGAAVVGDLPARAVCVGVPARAVRSTTGEPPSA
jgi:sugar O-acyltransferase (sialic acid O-acetyltransferase NeuD family)